MRPSPSFGLAPKEVNSDGNRIPLIDGELKIVESEENEYVKSYENLEINENIIINETEENIMKTTAKGNYGIEQKNGNMGEKGAIQ